jgi:hypothetical protein
MTAGVSPTPEPTAQQACKALVESLLVAAERADAASDAFDEILAATSNGTAHPDKIQRIKDASKELFHAFKDRMKADVQLHAFLEREIGSANLRSLRNASSNTGEEVSALID